MLVDAESVSLCSFHVGDATFGFDTHKVYEVLGVCVLHPVPLAPAFVAGITAYRGEILMVLSFRRLLGLEPWDRPSTVIVLQDEHEGEVFGLAVDTMGEILTLDESDFERNSKALEERHATLFAGSCKTGDGSVTYLKPELFWPMRLMELLATSEIRERMCEL